MYVAVGCVEGSRLCLGKIMEGPIESLLIHVASQRLKKLEGETLIVPIANQTES
jgi:hypothetical protein